MNRLPFVSIVIPAYNEEKYIEKTLASVYCQSYPVQSYEVIVADGGSTDNTLTIIKKYASRYSSLCLVNNTKKITSAGLNYGIKCSKGEVIIILGAHAYVDSDFIAENISALDKTDAICVGGTLVNVGSSYFSKSVALVLSSIFGVGNAYFRISSKERYVDTVAYGAYKREAFDAVGLFDEAMVRNQDIDFNYRLRDKGFKIFMTPGIKVYYNCHATLNWFASQYYRTGLWNVRMFWMNKCSLGLRHFMPLLFAVFVSAGLCSVITGIAGKKVNNLVFMFAAAYAAFASIFSLIIAMRNGIKYLPVLPLNFLVLHLSYGFGSLFGVFDFIKGNVKSSMKTKNNLL